VVALCAAVFTFFFSERQSSSAGSYKTHKKAGLQHSRPQTWCVYYPVTASVVLVVVYEFSLDASSAAGCRHGAKTIAVVLVSSSLALAVAVALATAAHSTHSTHVAAALAVVAALATHSSLATVRATLATVRTALATVRATLATVGAALAAVAVRAALATVRAALAVTAHSTHSTHAAAVSLAALAAVVAALATLAGGVVIVIHVDVTAQVALVDFLCYRFFGHDIDNFLLHDILSRNGGGEEGKDGESWKLHGAGFFGCCCCLLGGDCPASWNCEPMKKRTYLPLRSLFVLGGIVSCWKMFRHGIYHEPVACSGSTI
jgi:hypothetical protein